MTPSTAVLDTADWNLAVPLVTTDGSALDFSGTPLTAAVTDILGGPPITLASSEGGTLTFVPAAGILPAYFHITMPVAGRAWRVGRPTKVRADVKRYPDPAHPDRVEWVGRLEFLVLPGSDSTGIAVRGFGPVLIDAQPYDARILTAPMVVGPQGAPAAGGALPAAPEDAATNTYTLGLVDGVPEWALSLEQDFDLRRDGDGPAVIWIIEDANGAPLPIVGQAFTLSIRWDGGSISKDTASGSGLTADTSASTVTWTPTPTERLTVPTGRLAFYTLMCRAGAEQATIASGIITGITAA